MKEIIIKTPSWFSMVLKTPEDLLILNDVLFCIFNDFLKEWLVIKENKPTTQEVDQILIVQRTIYNLLNKRFYQNGEISIPEYIDAMHEANEIMSGLDSLYLTIRIINGVFDSHTRKSYALMIPDIEGYVLKCNLFRNALLEYTCLTFITPETAPDSDRYPENTIPSVE